MKFGSLLKKSIIFLMLLICILTVIPMLVMVAVAAQDGYNQSILKKLFDELES